MCRKYKPAIQQTDFVTKNGLVFFRVLAPIALIGILVTAGYMLMLIKRVFMGPLNQKWNWLPDMDARELIAVLPLIFLMILFGVYPAPLIALFDASINNLVEVARMTSALPPIGF